MNKWWHQEYKTRWTTQGRPHGPFAFPRGGQAGSIACCSLVLIKCGEVSNILSPASLWFAVPGCSIITVGFDFCPPGLFKVGKVSIPGCFLSQLQTNGARAISFLQDWWRSDEFCPHNSVIFHGLHKTIIIIHSSRTGRFPFSDPLLWLLLRETNGQVSVIGRDWGVWKDSGQAGSKGLNAKKIKEIPAGRQAVWECCPTLRAESPRN